MVYKIRVILDTAENIFRDIEIKDKQNLQHLHQGIKSAFSLQGDELSNYSILEDDGTVVREIPAIDMSEDGDGEILSDVYLFEAFDKVGAKGHFQYGLIELWEFYCELVEIMDEKPAVIYPITVFRFGKVPLKAPVKSSGKNQKGSMGMAAINDDLDFGLDELDLDDEDFDLVDDDLADDFHDVTGEDDPAFNDY